MLEPPTKAHQYARLGYEVESDEDAPARQSRLRRYWQHGRIHLFYVILLILVASASRTSSSMTQQKYYGEEPVKSELQLSTVQKTFELDLKYAMPPSPEVDEAWASLLPKEGGFFKHPRLAPRKSCVAVFHQLHCLDMIRQTLYEARPDFAARQQRHRNDTTAHDDHNHAHDMYHVGHCFDLVRQSILCRPDLTIEVGDPAIGGVTGFGTEHRCVDWEQLMGWMRDHE
ncbi:hypothetical protein LZ30DRAFT_597385 [Colletotrichum cereale]|nr:hypothetical protein LZ30DRAFT_597385 [Colletotrichum cereale]